MVIWLIVPSRDRLREWGTSVKINEVGEVTTAPYAGTVLYEELDDAEKILQINKSVYAGVTLDDVDATQSNVELMNKLSQRMGYAISDDIDQYLAGLHTEAGITVGATGSVKEIDSAVASPPSPALLGRWMRRMLHVLEELWCFLLGSLRNWFLPRLSGTLTTRLL